MENARVIPFDGAAVRQALRGAVIEAWAQVTSIEPREKVYGLTLYEGVEYGYICITPFTEEGLDEVTQKYRAGRWAERYLGDRGREQLRWSAPDSPHFETTRVSAPPLVSGDEQFDLWTAWGEDDEPGDAYVAAVRAIGVEVLRSLDDEGRFGPHRDDVTLLVESRDGNESPGERRALVEALNPPAVVARFDRHLQVLAEGADD